MRLFIFLLTFVITNYNGHSQSLKSPRPNIIFILADDLGYGDLSCYNDSSKINTPNIDRIAAGGLRFTNAHSPSSVCTPSRYGVLTGRYSWRTKLKAGVLWSYDWPLIEEGRMTIGNFLKNEGYRTAIIGKWHLGWRWPVKRGARIDTTKYGARSLAQSLEREKQIDLKGQLQGGPLACGFDYQFGLDIPSFPPFAFIENGKIVGTVPSKIKPDSISGYPGLMQEGWNSENILFTLMQKSHRFVEQEAASTKPFFLYLPLTIPHYPIAPAPSFKGTSKVGHYGDVVQEMDHYIGQLLELVNKYHPGEETIVIFSSDNGSVMDAGEMGINAEWGQYGAGYHLFGHHSNNHFKGIKGDIWEGGHRVPLIISWLGKIPENSISNHSIGLTDIFATVAGILGKSLPDSTADDSFNFHPLLFNPGSDTTIRESIIYHSSRGIFAIRKGKWKYIESNSSGGNLKNRYIPNDTSYTTAGQLYNMLEDPQEVYNLYDDYPQVVLELSRLLQQQKQQGTRY